MASDTPLRDCVDQIWDMRAELRAGEGYDRLDTIVTDAYAAGREEGAKAERERIRQLALEHSAHYDCDPAWGTPFADLLDGPAASVEVLYLMHWRGDRGEEFGVYADRDDADAAADERRERGGLLEVLSCQVIAKQGSVTDDQVVPPDCDCWPPCDVSCNCNHCGCPAGEPASVHTGDGTAAAGGTT